MLAPAGSFGQRLADERVAREKQLAQDRTSISKSLSVSATRKIKKDVNVTGDITLFDFEGTPTSGGESPTWDVE